jgi:uncharacterized protein (UPF0303 family)
MAIAEDIAKIIDQERGLVFAKFDEQVAFAVAMIVRDRAAAERLPVVCDIRLWDRPLFYFAMPGTSGDNPIWALRKSNTVRRLLKSSYRAVLEQGRSDEAFAEDRAMPAADYALSGGSFPISVNGAGVIGAITVSGLHQRDDHELAVAAICAHLGVENQGLSLPPRAAA